MLEADRRVHRKQRHIAKRIFERLRDEHGFDAQQTMVEDYVKGRPNMPNGGSDNCGTCWYNRKNRGQAGHGHGNNPEPHHCEIRDVPITEDPFYTYCANHQHHQPAGNRIPVGPIFAVLHRPFVREVWRASPDTEEVRQHLLEMLDGFPESTSRDRYPSPPGLINTIIWQLGEFREARAAPKLQWIAENGSGTLRDYAHRALESIRG